MRRLYCKVFLCLQCLHLSGSRDFSRDRLRRTIKAIGYEGGCRVSRADTVTGCRRQQVKRAHASEWHVTSLSYLYRLMSK